MRYRVVGIEQNSRATVVHSRHRTWEAAIRAAKRRRPDHYGWGVERLDDDGWTRVAVVGDFRRRAK